MIIRAWVPRVWDAKSTAQKLEMVNRFELPYQKKGISVIRKAVLDSYKFGRDRAKEVVRKSNKLERELKKKFASVQEFSVLGSFLPSGIELFYMEQSLGVDALSDSFIAEAQELVVEEGTYAKVAALYSQWVDKLGNDLWQRKVKAVKDTMIEGIEQGWSLRAVGHYENSKGNLVSAYEATGGKGGAANVLNEKGYAYIEDNPGILNQMGKQLEPYAYKGWQIERIARTEFTRAMNDGLVAIYQDDDAVVAFEWDAILDANTCQECAMMNGVVMQIGDPRLSYYQPPLHPHCRCIIQPVFAWEMVEANFDKERSVTLYNREGSPFEVTYTPNRISPDFLKPIRPSNDASAIKRQLIPKNRADKLRDNFKPQTAEDVFKKWMEG